ncbi:LuxR family transcriptional regulator [Mycobacterium sp. TY815]|uniref:helix-turn-helix transcriptional regulator n=1 Tax=Mycobacterium sp. TY815 TaxID=3050581 RepID=UPI0027403C23|nr:LuxR family transcriptional regulator [Mycobacterium sp. TY815]MDP7702044.1 AAA family ATPase [Mycobacterium sp. TY815]
MLHGRERECAQLDDLLAGARSGRSGVLVVRGEAGIGKSALLDYAVAQAGGMQVLRAAGIPAESQLPFAGVHTLLRPVLNHSAALPDRQRTALLGAFGLGPASIEDRFVVSLAVLGILAESAETSPLLCLVDDAQWLDGPSADTLTFAARRLQAEGVVVIFAVRGESAFSATGLPELRLEGIDADAAARLVTECTGTAVGPTVGRQLVAGTLGNPLAIAELARLLSGQQIAGRFALPDPLPVSTGLERLYSDRVDQLSPHAQSMLLVAAAHHSGELDGVLRAAQQLGAGPDVLDQAEAAGLVRVHSGLVSCVHPLMRSAVYHGATSHRRRQVERALALCLDADDDRKAWHLANAVAGPDDEVAEMLHAAGHRAAARGGHDAAAAAFERAASLTATAGLRADRLADAAAAAWSAGQSRRAQDILDQALPLAGGAQLRARIAHLRGSIEARCGNPSAAYAILVDAAQLIAAAEPARAALMLGEAGQLAWAGGDLAQLNAVADRLAALPAEHHPEFVAGHVVTGLSGLLRGDTTDTAGRLRAAVELAAAAPEPRVLMGAAAGAMFLGEDARAIDLFSTAVARTRAAADVATLPTLLAPLAMVETLTSRYTTALADATEGLRLAEETGQHNPAAHLHAVLALIAAVQGRALDCRDHAEATLSQAISYRLGPHAAIASWALAVLDLGAGRPEEACDRLESLAGAAPGEGNRMVTLMATPDLVDAAVRIQRLPAAAAGLAALQAWAGDTGAQWARALVARCRGLLADDGAADRHFDEALTLHAHGGRPFDTARTQLRYGESLRRRRRRAQARKYLRSAHETFERLGAAPWAELARTELLATGETARKRDCGTVDQLTPQELQIARFVSAGETNRSIATLMFLSPRTVDYHLRKIFTKLGLSSRAELIRMSLSQGW